MRNSPTEPNLTVELTGHFGDANKYASVPRFIFLCVFDRPLRAAFRRYTFRPAIALRPKRNKAVKEQLIDLD